MDLIILDPTENPVEDSFVPFPVRAHKPHVLHPNFTKEIDGDGICWLTINMPNTPANVWNSDSLDELDCHVEALHHDGVEARRGHELDAPVEAHELRRGAVGREHAGGVRVEGERPLRRSKTKLGSPRACLPKAEASVFRVSR